MQTEALLLEIKTKGGGKGRRKASILRRLPSNVKQRILLVESVDLLLVCAFLPLFTLTRYWKF